MMLMGSVHQSLHRLVPRVMNLGVMARLIFLFVKPLAVVVSLNLDPDKGTHLAQLFLIAMLFISVSGTNAHRLFYQQSFNLTGQSAWAQKRALQGYLHTLTGQLTLILVLLALCVPWIYPQSLQLALWGIVLGLTEKLYDEYQRYAQFCKDDVKLLKLSIIKVNTVLLSLICSQLLSPHFWQLFPLFYLLGVAVLCHRLLSHACYYRLRALYRHRLQEVWAMGRALGQDATQVLWVFLSASFLALDKWVIQYVDLQVLPKYLLCFQVASAFMVIQNIFILAPNRVDLMHNNPWQLKSLRYASPLLAALAPLSGIGLYSWIDNPVYAFAFYLIAVFVLSAPYLERLYWAVPMAWRLGLELLMAALVVLLMAMAALIQSAPALEWLLALVLLVMVLRLGLMIQVLRYVSPQLGTEEAA